MGRDWFPRVFQRQVAEEGAVRRSWKLGKDVAPGRDRRSRDALSLVWQEGRQHATPKGVREEMTEAGDALSGPGRLGAFRDGG